MTGAAVDTVPLLIISCDRYADLWKPFFQVFKKQWPDCPFPLYLGSNNLVCVEPGVTSITIGEDTSWSSGVRKMLEKLGSSHVIIFLEDFFISRPVDSAAVKRLVITAISEGVDCVRFAPLPAPTPLPETLVQDFPEFGIVEPTSPYRVSAQMAIWKTDALMKFLIPGANAWEFEHIGTLMSEELSVRFWGPFTPFISYDHGVEKGKWKPEGIRICTEAGVKVDTSIRPAFSPEELSAHLSGYGTNQDLMAEKGAAIAAFLNGKRITGLKLITRYLSEFPFDLQPWIILTFGFLGPQPLRWVRRAHLSHKIARIRSRENRTE